MSKAITGAALLGAVAIPLGVMTGGLGFAGMLAFMTSGATEASVLGSLLVAGASMEAGAIANALTSNRGMNITTRQPASNRQIVYGEQRVGGVIVYRSTTGSHKDQYNYVIVLAGHTIDSIQNLYLDGRQVYFNNGVGTTTRNGVTFGGSSNGNTYTGPNGVQYNFGGLVYCEACYGDQTSQPNTVPGGGYNTGLHANDPTWGPDAHGNTPYLGGCAYVYLKVVYDPNMFQGEPEIRFTIRGKDNILDPRTGVKSFSNNWALVCADVIMDTQFGLGDSSVNTTQLIAAANVCDESVNLVSGGSERRYTCNYHYDTSVAPGDAINVMMPAAAGRLSRIGGEWYLWPAYWQGPSFQFNESNLTGPMEWTPYRSYRDLFNRVTGTYIAANYPYNIAGNLYDSNGFFNGQIQNNFPFAFQPTNYPQYAADPLHGYANDQYLIQDTPNRGDWDTTGATNYVAGDVVIIGSQFYQALSNNNSTTSPTTDTTHWIQVPGRQLPKEISQQCVLSVSQAQRVAKIYLMRNRQQGSGKFQMNLAAWQMQPCDVMNFTYAQNGWVAKVFEIDSVRFEVSEGSKEQPPTVRAEFGVIETDPSVYNWNTGEELTVYSIANVAAQTNYTPAPPTNMTLLSSAATAVVAPDGTLQPRIEVQWTTPYDILVSQIQVQYQVTGASTWVTSGLVDVSLNQAFIGGIIAGQNYNVRIRSLRPKGGTSVWVEIDAFTATLVLNSQGEQGVGIGTLVASAFADGTAGIECMPFTFLVGQVSLSIFPSGAYDITGLAQQTRYYVYYIDPTNVGGNVTPIATTNKTDFLGKPGYYLIDAATTPYSPPAGGGGSPGSGARYYPSTYQDTGTRTTQNPYYAFDGTLTTAAVISATANQYTSSSGNCVFQGDPSITLAGVSTLTIVADVATLSANVTGNTAIITASIAGTPHTMLSLTDQSVSQTTYTLSIPANTLLSGITVTVSATCQQPTGPGNERVTINVYEIYIQS